MEPLHWYIHSARVMARLVIDLVRLLGTALRSPTNLAAENLFLRKQLARYRERQVNLWSLTQ